MKRAFDFVLSLMGLLTLWPLFILLAIVVKMDSAGPVFYRGVRAGRLGKPFRIFKLRTMVVNADQIGGAETPNDDPRITRVGSFLRRYKLDELPQLINVLRGDMSLVGPRPEVMDEVVRYTEEEKQLLQVQPGITDWASIKFRHEGEILRGSTDPHRTYHEAIRPEKIRLGLHYVRNRSLFCDVKIIFRTLVILFE
jgi:lipopolysaccharide/colanic/teichoic acid biosynthesis glycosyltransferase